MKRITLIGWMCVLAMLAGCGGGGSGSTGAAALAPDASTSAGKAADGAGTADAEKPRRGLPADPSNPSSGWVVAAQERQQFQLAAPHVVMYGASGRYTSRQLSGIVTCDNATFGDPIPYTVKACYVSAAAAADLVPLPGTGGGTGSGGSGGEPMAGDVVDANAAVVVGAYRDMAARMGTPAGVEYRYGPGPDAATLAATMPTLYQREDHLQRCDGSGFCSTSWQVGGPWDASHAGAYSTMQANVLYLPDDPVARTGVADLQVAGFDSNVYEQKPQLLWQNGGRQVDSTNTLTYRASGVLRGDGSVLPVAAGRCAGPVGTCATSVVAFQDGLVATTGSNTAHNHAWVRLAAGKVPTAVAVTTGGEFALVTVWDTLAVKGQLAVIALAGLCDGCNLAGPYYDWWNEWAGVYPGLPNMGNIAFMKVLGYVDLPGLAAPTGVATTTGLHPFDSVLGGGLFMGYSNSPLDAHWTSFVSGGSNYRRYAKGGVAVVVSKSERSVAFVDLTPLFAYVNGTYFSAQVGKLGLADVALGRWPYTFGEHPEQAPRVVKTQVLDDRPTAVRTTVTLAGTGKAWVATQAGSLRIFTLGGYAPGGLPMAGAPDQIQLVGSVAVGRNPTSLGTSKGEEGMERPFDDQVIVAARADRAVQWVRFSTDGRSGSVVRTLTDARLRDPIAVEDVDNFANVGYTVSVADWSTRSILNYRYGPVIFADRSPGWNCQPPGGCPVVPTNGIAIEFGGGYELPGRPFQLNTSNVP